VLSTAPDRASVLGGIVRLAFHDAGSFDSGTNTGGADGCVDMSASENNGLEPIINALQPAVLAVQGRLSRADVWALAAGMAIEFAGGPDLEFHTGRVDSSSCSGHGSRMPDAELGRAHIIDIFVTRLGFTERESATLMGAHVLGQATQGISGYNGPWVRNNDRFSNDYFRDLVDRRWNRNRQPNFGGMSRTQWDGPRNTMMLNTDIEIAFDTSGGCTRAGGRGRGGCPRASGNLSAAVTEFSQRRGQTAFFQAFPPAFKKLMSLGTSVLDCPFSDCSTPGPF